MAFDRFEPIGSRPPLDLLALLISVNLNTWRSKSTRAILPGDILPDPLAPRRLTPAEEATRTASIAADYRRRRAERLAKMGSRQSEG